MANARIVLAQGLIDGVNTIFSTSVPYVAGSTAYILNGRIHNKALARGPENDYGYIELSADAGTIQVDIPPETDDVVQIFFWDRLVTPPPPITVLVGTIPTGPGGGTSSSGRPLQGVIRDPAVTRLSGVLQANKLTGVVRSTEPGRLSGVVRGQRIIGTIKERC
jgi:hypothetical protein